MDDPRIQQNAATELPVAESPSSETAPLLPKPRSTAHHTSILGAALVAEGTDSYAYPEIQSSCSSGKTSKSFASAPYGSIGKPRDDEERASIEDNVDEGLGDEVSYQGMPEVMERMPFIFPAVGIGVFLAALDQTVIVTSYGKIGSDLKALSSTGWIATAYFLTLTSFQPLYGKLSDIFGRKSCLLFAYAVFATGCLFCGMSTTINQLIFSRAFAGIGGGGMTTVVSILLSDVVPTRQRGTWQGYINIVYATGSALGAPLGGILADFVGWRLAFWGQTPLCAIALVAVSINLKLPTRDDESVQWKHKLKRIDFLGAIILFLAVASLLLGLDRGSNLSWDDLTTIVALALSPPLFFIFFLVEKFIASEPFAPGHIIFSRNLIGPYLCNFFSFAAWMGCIFYISLYFQAVRDLSATQASTRLIPCIIASVSGSLFGGYYMQHTGRYRMLTITSYSTLTFGLVAIVLSSGAVGTSTPALIASMVVCGFSNGIGITSSLIALIASAGRKNQAVATACSYLFRSLGSVSGVAVSSAVVNQALRGFLLKELGRGQNGDAARKIAEKVRQSLEIIRTLEPAEARVVRACYAKSTEIAFAVQALIVFGSAVSAYWIVEKKLGK